MTSSDAAAGSDQFAGRRAAESGPPAGYGRAAAPSAAPRAKPHAAPMTVPPVIQPTTMQAVQAPAAAQHPMPVDVPPPPQDEQMWQRQSYAAPPSSVYDPPKPAPSQPSSPSAAAAAAAAAASSRTRQARLRLSRLDPWSVMKVSFVLSVALGIITIIAVSVLWMVLDQMGVFASISKSISDITSTSNTGGVNLPSYLSFGNVFGISLIIALIDIVLMTALSTLGTFLYNLAAGMVGGVEVTLAEDD